MTNTYNLIFFFSIFSFLSLFSLHSFTQSLQRGMKRNAALSFEMFLDWRSLSWLASKPLCFLLISSFKSCNWHLFWCYGLLSVTVYFQFLLFCGNFKDKNVSSEIFKLVSCLFSNCVKNICYYYYFNGGALNVMRFVVFFGFLPDDYTTLGLFWLQRFWQFINFYYKKLWTSFVRDMQDLV